MQEPVVRLRIELQDIAPTIWRRVDVPLSSTLLALHDVIQGVMRWDDAHLFEFRVGERVYGEPPAEVADLGRKVARARNAHLSQLIKRGVERFLYVYDFGDDWRHDLIVEEVRAGEDGIDYPCFVDGERRAPPEDVGGLPGFEQFLEAIGDPKHEDHADLVAWSGGGFAPDDIDRPDIVRDLAVLAEFRRRALVGHRTRSASKPH